MTVNDTLRKYDLSNYHVIKIWLRKTLKYRNSVMMDLWYTVLYWPPPENIMTCMMLPIYVMLLYMTL